ncbi:MAG: PRC-barrel domain-containing protein [Nevskia sp.]|nr:PRC-barrel domain-containing protein [Nevskia sp.]
MLHRMDKLIGLRVVASDGEVGTVGDVYFDDYRWAARYLTVETGSWLDSRKLLISPLAIDSVDYEQGTIGIRLDRQQVRDSPDIDTRRPMSRQHELGYFNYYGYPDYHSGPLLWGLTPYPMVPDEASLPLTISALVEVANTDAERDVSHLRSAGDICDFVLHATDDVIGHFEDFILESDSWALRYVVVETSNFWVNKHVVVPVQWITRIDQTESQVHVDVPSAQIREAPEYDPAIALSRDYETQLFGHYQRQGYWY